MGANGGCRHLNGKRGALTPRGRNSWGLGFRRRQPSNLAQAHVLLPELTLSKAEVVVPVSPAATAPPSSAQDLLSLTDLGTSVKVEPRRGDDIFGDGPYPRAFHDFVGQDLAKQQLITAINSARIRQQRMDHTLLASGTPGIGKTSLAKLCAASLGSVGYVELSGTVTEKDARAALHSMQDNDVLCIDEIHRLVANGKKNAEWLLHLLQYGVLMTAHGAEQVAKVTVIATTTEAQKLPAELLDQFMVKAQLVPYTAQQATEIAKRSASKMGFGGYHPGLPMPADDWWLQQIAEGSGYSPAVMQLLLLSIRDTALCSGHLNLGPGGYDVATHKALLGRTELDLATQSKVADELLAIETSQALGQSYREQRAWETWLGARDAATATVGAEIHRFCERLGLAKPTIEVSATGLVARFPGRAFVEGRWLTFDCNQKLYSEDPELWLILSLPELRFWTIRSGAGDPPDLTNASQELPGLSQDWPGNTPDQILARAAMLILGATFGEALPSPWRWARHQPDIFTAMADLLLAQGIETSVAGLRRNHGNELGGRLSSLGDACMLLDCRQSAWSLSLRATFRDEPVKLDLGAFITNGFRSATDIDSSDPIISVGNLTEAFLAAMETYDCFPATAIDLLPPTFSISTPQEAESAMAAWLRWLGEARVTLTAPGADAGIDIEASGLVAQVKAEAGPVGRPAVQRLAGIAAHRGTAANFFSLSGYTQQAADWASQVGMALFTFDRQGAVEAVSPAARARLVLRAQAATSQARSER